MSPTMTSLDHLQSGSMDRSGSQTVADDNLPRDLTSEQDKCTVNGLSDTIENTGASRLRQDTSVDGEYKSLRNIETSLNCPDRSRDFQSTKSRINQAFEHLRKEMKDIQRQDILLLKQLMYIRHTILLLSKYGDRRSYSISVLDPPSESTVEPPVGQLSQQRRRPSLTRVQSAPLERRLSEETIIEDIDESEETDDELGQSFNSAASDSLLPSCSSTAYSGRPTPDTDFIYAIGPLPPVFQRLLAASSASNGNTQDVDASATPTLRYQHYRGIHIEDSVLGKDDHLCNEKSLLKLVAKRRLFQRQRSVEDQDYSPTTLINGHAVIENLRRQGLTVNSEVQV